MPFLYWYRRGETPAQVALNTTRGTLMEEGRKEEEKESVSRSLIPLSPFGIYYNEKSAVSSIFSSSSRSHCAISLAIHYGWLSTRTMYEYTYVCVVFLLPKPRWSWPPPPFSPQSVRTDRCANDLQPAAVFQGVHYSYCYCTIVYPRSPHVLYVHTASYH